MKRRYCSKYIYIYIYIYIYNTLITCTATGSAGLPGTDVNDVGKSNKQTILSEENNTKNMSRTTTYWQRNDSHGSHEGKGFLTFTYCVYTFCLLSILYMHKCTVKVRIEYVLFSCRNQHALLQV